MTGEMYREDVTEDEFPLHFAIAKAFGGTVEPFDVYQGPYVCIGGDVRVGDAPYALAVQGLGIVRLWLCVDEGCEAFGYIYNEANEKQSELFPLYPRNDTVDETSRINALAVEAAKEVLS